MIAQVLNRNLVLEEAERLLPKLDAMAQAPRRRAAPPAALAAEVPGLAELGPEDFAAARELLEESRQAEAPPPEGAPAIDDVAYISGNAGLSVLQTALEVYLDLAAPHLVEERHAAEGRRGGETAPPPVTNRVVAGAPPVRDTQARRVGGAFSETDPRWVSSLVAMGARWLKKRAPFPKEAAPPRTVADNARVLLVGDWGSGLPRARKISDEMRKVLDQGKAEGLEQHVVHLGDVYYSGWAYEYRKRFLAHWPVRDDEAREISSWNLNGNHDMYAGGHAFFDTALADPRFAPWHQGSSYFSLANDHWQILGLDSAYDDHGLAGDQATWARDLLTAPESEGRQGLLLSHHQIFSSYEKKSPSSELAQKIQTVLATGKVRSWFWGHEHRCVLYEPHGGVHQARCLGHGGVPVYQPKTDDDPVGPPGAWEFRRRFHKGLPFEHWAVFGFAVLDFAGPKIAVRYIDEDGGDPHHQEEITHPAPA